MEGWRSWSALHQAYKGPWRDLVQHSGRVLQALTFAPTGAIVAAPTTSLPEAVGGGRNWDYRYTWVRDASLTMEALWVAACPDEAGKFFGFLADAAASELRRGKDLQIMFGVGGEHDLSERELPHLAGWRASRPVRVGNGAWPLTVAVLDAAPGSCATRPQPSWPPQRYPVEPWNGEAGYGDPREPRASCTPSSCARSLSTGAIALAPLLSAPDRAKAARPRPRADARRRPPTRLNTRPAPSPPSPRGLDTSSLLLTITGPPQGRPR